jgi:hypothetical protein
MSPPSEPVRASDNPLAAHQNRRDAREIPDVLKRVVVQDEQVGLPASRS